MTLELLVQQDSAQVRMAQEPNSVEVPDLAFHPVGGGPDAHARREFAGVFGNPDLHAKPVADPEGSLPRAAVSSEAR